MKSSVSRRIIIRPSSLGRVCLFWFEGQNEKNQSIKKRKNKNQVYRQANERSYGETVLKVCQNTSAFLFCLRSKSTRANGSAPPDAVAPRAAPLAARPSLPSERPPPSRSPAPRSVPRFRGLAPPPNLFDNSVERPFDNASFGFPPPRQPHSRAPNLSRSRGPLLPR